VQLISDLGNGTRDYHATTYPHDDDDSLDKGSWSRAFQAVRRTAEDGGATHNPSHDDTNWIKTKQPRTERETGKNWKTGRKQQDNQN